MRAFRSHLMVVARLAALLSFFCIPLWTRLTFVPLGFAPYHVVRFVIVLPMLTTIFCWLVAGAPGLFAQRRTTTRSLWALSLLTVALWTFASLSWAFIRERAPDIGETAALKFGIVALFATAVAHLEIAPRRAIYVLAISLAFNAVIAVTQSLHQGWIGLEFLREFVVERGMSGISVIRAGDLQFVRPYGLMPHPNMLAGTLVVGTLAASMLIVHERRWIRYTAAGLISFSVLAILLTFSRAAWGGFAVGVIIVFPFVARRALNERTMRVPIIAAVVFIVLIGVGFLIQYRPFLAARTGQVQESLEMRSVADRLVYIDFALRSIQERPILGVGAGNFPWRMSYYLVDTFYDLRGDNVHNIYLAALAELGIIGFGLYAMALTAGLVSIIGAIRRANIPERAPLMGLFAALIALLVIGLLDHYPYTIIQFQTALWGLMGVGVGATRQIAPKT